METLFLSLSSMNHHDIIFRVISIIFFKHLMYGLNMFLSLFLLYIGAFLIPYCIMLLVCGLPLMFFELCLGQFGREGPITVWKICPLFQGKYNEVPLCVMVLFSTFTCARCQIFTVFYVLMVEFS